MIGSCGYWIETAKDVQPVITREADHFVKYPAYQESFDYADGTAFNGENAKDKQAWETTGSVTVKSGALNLTGTATVKNVKLPKNITAGDSYAMQQAWEISVTLPKAMNWSRKTFFPLLRTRRNFLPRSNAIHSAPISFDRKMMSFSAKSSIPAKPRTFPPRKWKN